MKNFYVIIAVIILTCYSASAQNIKASEGLAKAKQTVTISNPEILAIATKNGTVPGAPLTISFDMSKGTATAWVYVFRSADNHDTKKTCIVGKLPVVGLTGYEIPDVTSIPPLPLSSLEGIAYIDSDVMIGKVKEAQDYKNFMNQYANAKPDLVTLMYNASYTQIPQDVPYWLVKVNSGGDTEPSIICAVNALTQETTCFSATTSVSELTSNEIAIKSSPNPTTDNALIFIPKSIQSDNSKLILCDLDGRTVQEFQSPIQGDIEYVLINLSGYNQGTYFAKYITENKSYFVKINLIK